MPDLESFKGIVVLDNDRSEAYLEQAIPDSEPVRYLLTLDPLSTGVLNWQQVANAWQLYSTTPGLQSGVTEISFIGFWTTTDDGEGYILHIVKP